MGLFAVILRPFGATARDVPVLGQGTWNVPLRGAPADEAKRALRRGIEQGMTHIDTAEMYGEGGSEVLIGEAIRGLPRDALFIASKVLPSNASFAGTIRACEASLARLGLDYLDCYMLHWRGSVPLRDTMRAMEKLVADGKIRSIGVSNFEVEDLKEAHEALEREPLACNQVLYHLGERTVEDHELAYCRDHGIALVAYTPFGRGDYEDRAGMHVLEGIAKRYGATVRQVILAFLTRDPITFAIPKASTVAHVEENAGAGDLRLDTVAIDEVDAAFPLRRRRGGLPTL
ncbi:MAG: aldo/keto reductase [Candidatus Velthaea sp.]